MKLFSTFAVLKLIWIMQRFKKYIKKGAGFGLILFLCFLNGHISARETDINPDTIVYRPILSYKFPKSVPNRIIDREGIMGAFFDKLSVLRTVPYDSLKTVSVIHIGDSHVQADFFTGTTRKLLNHYFGNPGRGLIAPHKLMRSNNGRHYKITSTNQWQHSFVVKPNNLIPIGLTGMGLQVKGEKANVNIHTVDESFPGEWDFNKITAYGDFEKSDMYFDCANVAEVDSICTFAKSILLDSHTNNIDISFVSPDEKEISLFGFNLSNGRRGVFYHSIGINGARYHSYNQCSDFYHQIASLNPELVIISMGTNEAMTRMVDEEELYANISDLVFFVRHSSPNATVLLTTPSETYTRNRRGANPQVGKVRDVIVEFAEKNGYPYWDLYNITGGKGSAPEWSKKGLMLRDKIHLTQRGYEFVGELLFEAVINLYNQHIKQSAYRK
jgi:lysophospholipase L1-like esterase